MRSILIIMIVLALVQCKPVVEIDNPIPEKVVYCEIPSEFLGHWTSDSVWIETNVDSTDTVLLNTRPTYYYDLTLSCNEDTSFLLKYTNYSGVVTREVSSVNYLLMDSTLMAFDAFDDSQEPENATFSLMVLLQSDSMLYANYEQILNSDQRSKTHLWMRRSN